MPPLAPGSRTRCPAHHAQYEHPFEFSKRHRLVPGPVGEGTVWDLIARAKPRERRPNNASTSGKAATSGSASVWVKAGVGIAAAIAVPSSPAAEPTSCGVAVWARRSGGSTPLGQGQQEGGARGRRARSQPSRRLERETRSRRDVATTAP